VRRDRSRGTAPRSTRAWTRAAVENMSGNALRRGAHVAVRAAMREGARGAPMAPRGIGPAGASAWCGAADGCVDATRDDEARVDDAMDGI